MPKCSRGGSEPSQTDHEQSLYLIQATQSSGTINTVHDSILDSIEKSSSQTGICFKALIHRVLHNIDTREKVDRYVDCLIIYLKNHLLEMHLLYKV